MESKIDYFKYVDNFVTYSNIKSIRLYGSEKKDYKVTIAIPTYKRVKLLREALESALKQEMVDDYEIIIVDNDADFKNKECLELVKSFNSSKIKYYKNEKNIGMFGNWNRCIELANGQYITLLNDDDWLENNFLYEVIKVIQGKKAIYTETNIVDLRNIKKTKKNDYLKMKKLYLNIKKLKKIRKYTTKDFFYGNRSAGSLGILFHKDSLKSLGGYNPDFFPSSDYFYQTNYIDKFGGIKLKKSLCNYRVFENESMKLETAQKWPIIDSKFREYLSQKLFKKCNIVLLKHLKESQINSLNENWNTNVKATPKEFKLFYKLYLNIREKILEILG